MRYRAFISYDGSKYYGFQRLKGHITVQDEIEKALSKINKSVVTIKGAGRTDRGVHAFNQAIHFDLNQDIPINGLISAVNSILPPSIHVNNIDIVNEDFHARFDVKSKVYEYVINMGEHDAIDNDYIYNYGYELDIKKMKKASKYLLGAHSFEAFTSGERDNYNSIITKIRFIKKKDILVIRFEGKSFYRYMVRNMVGSLISIGSGRNNIDFIKTLINNKKTNLRYITAPASGLYLVNVIY